MWYRLCNPLEKTSEREESESCKRERETERVREINPAFSILPCPSKMMHELFYLPVMSYNQRECPAICISTFATEQEHLHVSQQDFITSKQIPHGTNFLFNCNCHLQISAHETFRKGDLYERGLRQDIIMKKGYLFKVSRLCKRVVLWDLYYGCLFNIIKYLLYACAGAKCVKKDQYQRTWCLYRHYGWRCPFLRVNMAFLKNGCQ